MSADFNSYSELQSLSAATPQALASVIRQIPYTIQIVSITSNDQGHHCFFKCKQKITVVKGKPRREVGTPKDGS